MRWRRSLRRLLAGLLFLCMTVKIRMELRSLASSSSTATGSLDSPATNKSLVSDESLSEPLRTSLYAVKERSHLGSTVPPKRNATLNGSDRGAKRGENAIKKGLFAKLGIGEEMRTNENSEGSARGASKEPKAAQRAKSAIGSGPAEEAPPPSRGGGKLTKAQKKRGAPHGGPKKGVSHEVDSTEVSLTEEAIAKIKRRLEVENELQKIHNEDRYGRFLGNTSILLVQVHNRLENLRYLVGSMKKVRGIHESLVIFSHDLWDPAINAFVRNITEFRVMQIFFPFSIQLHPFSFPGRDPRDCSWNVNRRESLECLNHQWPDSYGHYREAAFTQIKHHWWWKIHRVFEGLRVTKTNYSGHVVFLEEDHYVSPDLLHVLSLLRRSRATLCPTCQVLALGNYNKLSTTVYKNYVERGNWWVTKHNLGFALDVASWRTLASCRSFFCQFDDYNWDWTLNALVQTCLKPRMSMLSVRFSRVVHVGSCGTHVRKKSCDVRREVQSAISRFSSGRRWLFQDSVRLQSLFRSSGRSKKGNGGWGDHRDRELCLAVGNGTATEDTLRRLQFP